MRIPDDGPHWGTLTLRERPASLKSWDLIALSSRRFITIGSFRILDVPAEILRPIK